VKDTKIIPVSNCIFKKMIFFANWKIYMKSRKEVKDYIEKIKSEFRGFDSEVLEVHIMTDFLSFEYAKQNFSALNIKVGVQDLFWEDSGSYAGAISPLMLNNLGCDSAYLGHSERKLYFGETDENINKKVLACLRNNVIALMFIGETKEELGKGLTKDVLRRQLNIGLTNVTAEMLNRIVLIYEPRWAIGQKDSASTTVIKSMHVMTKELLAELYDVDTVKKIRILYGGSVNLENIEEIIEIKEVDGVGAARAALNPLDFIKLVRKTEIEAKKRFNLNNKNDFKGTR